MRLDLTHDFFIWQAEIVWDTMRLGNVPGGVDIHFKIVAVRVWKINRQGIAIAGVPVDLDSFRPRRSLSVRNSSRFST